MNTPPDQNTRAEAMWRIISQEVDFRKQRVIDLGCGTGDFLWRVYVAGAEIVIGVDNKEKVEPIFVDDREDPDGMMPAVNGVFNWDINKMIYETPSNYIMTFDIVFCFSVLPYLDTIPATLQWMSSNFPLCLIEAQYDPEPYNVGIASDIGMAQLLVNNGFSDVKPIGKTYVDIRDTWRTIWRCE